MEDNRISLEVEEYQAIRKSDVDRTRKNDRLGDQHRDGPGEDLDKARLDVDGLQLLPGDVAC